MFQAIASMMRAQEADPTNLEVLLALGVSYTNGKYQFSNRLILFVSRIVCCRIAYVSYFQCLPMLGNMSCIRSRIRIRVELNFLVYII